MQKLSVYLFIGVYVLIALFGVAFLAPMGSEMACPFAAGCMSAVEYLSHWQGAFAAVLAEVIGLCLFALTFFILGSPPIARFYRYRPARTPVRPTLLQELFSRGILHRKEP